MHGHSMSTLCICDLLHEISKNFLGACFPKKFFVGSESISRLLALPSILNWEYSRPMASVCTVYGLHQ